MTTKYKIIREDRAAFPVEIGEVVYKSEKYDYGLASDDTRTTGIDYVSVTFKEDGYYPFFTIPRQDLEEL